MTHPNYHSSYYPIRQKQSADNNHFRYAWSNIEKIISKAQVEDLIASAVQEVNQVTSGKEVGFGWSAGKDSQALLFVMQQCGIRRCVMGMTNDLEYPEFLQWVTDHMPKELDVVDSGLTLQWLAEHQDMLFPKDSLTAAKWFKLIQHKAQEEFKKKYALDIVIVGRRKLDTNYVGKGTNIYTNAKGITRYSPIAEWSHEAVMGCVHYFMNRELPPIYDWPNGWVVGTGCWPGRQWHKTDEGAWYDIWIIDPNIVRKASTVLQSAREFMTKYRYH